MNLVLKEAKERTVGGACRTAQAGGGSPSTSIAPAAKPLTSELLGGDRVSSGRSRRNKQTKHTDTERSGLSLRCLLLLEGRSTERSTRGADGERGRDDEGFLCCTSPACPVPTVSHLMHADLLQKGHLQAVLPCPCPHGSTPHLCRSEQLGRALLCSQVSAANTVWRRKALRRAEG